MSNILSVIIYVLSAPLILVFFIISAIFYLIRSLFERINVEIDADVEDYEI